MLRADTQYDEFLLANYEILTLTDMAYELGVSTSRLSYSCQRLGITPLKRKKQVENFIRDHNHWPIERLAKVLEMGISHINAYLVEFAIELKPTPKAIKRNIWDAEVLEYIAEIYGTITPSNIERPPAIYTQTGSDFLDNRNGIKTTIRDIPLAIKAKIK